MTRSCTSCCALTKYQPRMRTRAKAQNKRFLLIDAVRGSAIISMILFHFMYDLNQLFGLNTEWYDSPSIHIWQQSICCTFILVSGFVWQLSARSVRVNIKRGVLLNIFGLIITLVTLIAAPSEPVWFGILSFMGCAVMLMIPLHRLFQKLSPVLGLVVTLALFVLCRDIKDGIVGINSLWTIAPPELLYDSKLLTIFGFPYSGFYSSDYFPILPWFLLFAAGYFLYSCAKDRMKGIGLMYTNIPLLSAMGRKSIEIYMLHQPVCMAVIAAAFLILNPEKLLIF